MDGIAARLGVKPGSEGHELYGFNNPNPSAGTEEYGYELWMRVAPGTEVEGPVEIREIPAASYAVTRLTGLSNIGRVWREFWAWYQDREDAPAPVCGVPCGLEALQNPWEPDFEKWVFDLYLPSGER